VERRNLQVLKDNKVLTVLPTDKSNMTVELDTADYNKKIVALPSTMLIESWKRTPTATESMECKIMLPPKKSSISEEIWQQLQAQGSRSLRLYGLPTIQKQGA
jgi:hypothetical protein